MKSKISLLCYLSYIGVCNLSVYIVGKNLMEAPVVQAFQTEPRYLLKVCLFILLGIIWTIEDVFASKTDERIVMWIRGVNVIWLVALCLSMFLTKRFTYVNLWGMEPEVALLAGMLLTRMVQRKWKVTR